MRTNVPAALRALRRRKGWRQADLGERAGVSRDVVSRAERAELAGMTMDSLDRIAAALGGTLAVDLRWHGADLDRLIDRDHALLQDVTARRLESLGWVVRSEVTFNHYGDRGSCDLVAWHASTRTLLIVEAKSRLGNLQETLHRLDTKSRLSAVIARSLGWAGPVVRARALVILDGRTNRRVVAAHPALLGGFAFRGRSAAAWLRAPSGAGEAQLLWFERLPDSYDSRVTAGPRVRNGRPAR